MNYLGIQFAIFREFSVQNTCKYLARETVMTLSNLNQCMLVLNYFG